MRYQRQYHGTIWTTHALERLQERGIKQGDAYAAFARPDHSRYSKSRGGWVYTRSWSDQSIEIVSKQNERGEWVILSVWAKPSASPPRPRGQSLLTRLINWLYPPKP